MAYPFRNWKGSSPHAWLMRGLMPILRRRSNLSAPAGSGATAPLNDAVSQIKLATDAFEKDFGVAVADLEHLATYGDQFVAISEKLVSRSSGKSGETTVYHEAMKRTELPLAFLEQSRNRINDLLERLRVSSERMDRFVQSQAEIQRTVAPLKYIQTLFRIESASMGADVQTLFGALTADIEKLHNQVCEVFTAKALELREVQRKVDHVREELHAQTELLWATISKERTLIDQSLLGLQQQIRDNQAREPRICGVAREIKGQIQEIVTGLQFEDIIVQKLTHSSHALAKVEEQVKAGAEPSLLATAYRLEAAQIKAVRGDLQGASTRIKSSAQGLVEHLTEAGAQCLSLSEFQQLIATTNDVVQALLDIYTTLRTEVAATVGNTSQAFGKLESVGGLASDLTVVVRNLSQRIHLIGLNAQLQAAHVQNGASLEALSARTNEISIETRQISGNIAEGLDAVVAALAASVRDLHDLHSEAREFQQTLEDEEQTGESGLHAIRDGILASLGHLTHTYESIRSEAMDLTGVVDSVLNADPILADLERDLHQAAEAFGASTDTSVPQTDVELQAFRNDYTMASERQVFAHVVGGEQPVESPHSESSVELFDEIPLSQSSATEALPDLNR